MGWRDTIDFLAADAAFRKMPGVGWEMGRAACGLCKQGGVHPSRDGETLRWFCPDCGRELARKEEV